MKKIICLAVVIIIVASCKKSELPALAVPVLATTTTISAITSTSATSGGNITSDGGAAITERGICYNTTANPTTANSKVTSGNGTGSFTANMTGLTGSTIYYVRSYATNSAGTGYGTEVSFTTQGGTTVTDVDGNVYNTVTIGTQTWMKENLNTTRYRNNDPITNVTGNTAWINLTSGGYCNYDNSAANATTYGRLYNWYAVNDSRKIAPAGWHVATDAEWLVLETYLGGWRLAGGPLKEAGTSHWTTPNTGATNSSGFKALPGGVRKNDGPFNVIGNSGYWWTSTQSNNTANAWGHTMNYSYVEVYSLDIFPKRIGCSVRCVKD